MPTIYSRGPRINRRRPNGWLQTKRGAVTGTASLVATATLANSVPAGPSYYRPITIDHTKVGSGGVTNFPVLVAVTHNDLRTVANGGKVRNSSGFDITFYSDPHLTTKLDFEIESYNALTGAIAVWVRVPSLSSATDTVIYMGYGDAGIGTNQSKKTTWDTGFVGVYHMAETAASKAMKDSSQSANHGTYSRNASVGTTTGKNTNGITFGAGDDASLGSSMEFDDNFTMSAWAYCSPNVSNGQSTFGSGDVANDMNFCCGGTSGNYRWWTGNTGSPTFTDVVTDDTATSAGNWVHVVITRNAKDGVALLYHNGTLQGTTGSNSGSFFVSKFAHGAAGAGGGISLDEMRMSTAVRDAAWITTEYNSQNSPSTFLSLGSPVFNGAGALIGRAVMGAYGMKNPLLITMTGIQCSNWSEVTRSGAENDWANEGNAQVSDNAYANSPDSTGGADNNDSNWLQGKVLTGGSGYGVSSIPDAARIVGIVANWERKASANDATTYVIDEGVSLVVDNVITGDDKKDVATKWPTTDTVKSYGSSTDKWGQAAITGAQVKGNFGMAIAIRCFGTGMAEEGGG